jgi:hypothetical protein
MLNEPLTQRNEPTVYSVQSGIELENELETISRESKHEYMLITVVIYHNA